MPDFIALKEKDQVYSCLEEKHLGTADLTHLCHVGLTSRHNLSIRVGRNLGIILYLGFFSKGNNT